MDEVMQDEDGNERNRNRSRKHTLIYASSLVQQHHHTYATQRNSQGSTTAHHAHHSLPSNPSRPDARPDPRPSKTSNFPSLQHPMSGFPVTPKHVQHPPSASRRAISPSVPPPTSQRAPRPWFPRCWRYPAVAPLVQTCRFWTAQAFAGRG